MMEIAIVIFIIVFAFLWMIILIQQSEIEDLEKLNDLYKDAYEKTYADFEITAKEYHMALEKWNKDIKARLKELKDGNDDQGNY